MNNKTSGKLVRKAHLHAKIGSLQSRPLDILRETKQTFIMIIKIKRDGRDSDKVKLIHEKWSPFGPYKMDKVERRKREIIDNY